MLSAPFRRARLAAVLLGSIGAAFAQMALVANSPFAPAAGQGGAGADSAEAYELAGSSVQGSDIEVCVFDRQAKRSEWIPVGASSKGIHVISFDPVNDRAVVTIGGARKELALRKHSAAASTFAAAAPVYRAVEPAPEPVQPQGPTEPVAQAPTTLAARDQTEARMLVSDLLEIGVQQRKAYQDAKLKSASEAPAQPAN